jgi:uridine kinase
MSTLNKPTDLAASNLPVISGPPGSGKTTIARMLADTAERSTVHLVTDLFYIAIRKGFVQPTSPRFQ